MADKYFLYEGKRIDDKVQKSNILSEEKSLSTALKYIKHFNQQGKIVILTERKEERQKIPRIIPAKKGIHDSTRTPEHSMQIRVTKGYRAVKGPEKCIGIYLPGGERLPFESLIEDKEK